MKKREWFYILAPIFITWGIDRITKQLAFGIQGFNFYTFFGLVFHPNHGAMLGLFSDLPPLLRIVSLSTGGAFLLFSYAAIQLLLPIKSMSLRVGMSFLLGGILGNVTDRIIYGYVVDFLILGTPDRFTPAFNAADALQWLGYIMIVVALIREGDILWPAQNIRKQYWVNPSFQLKYCMILMGVGFGLSIIAGVYSYTFIRVIIIDLVGPNPHIIDKFLTPFIITFSLVSIFFGVLLFLIGRVLSHRTAGPLYAFEKFLTETLKGDARSLKLRTKDEFKHLEKLAVTLAERINYDKQLIARLQAEENSRKENGTLTLNLENESMADSINASLEITTLAASLAEDLAISITESLANAESNSVVCPLVSASTIKKEKSA